MNPFLLKGYLGPKYFCDRAEESDKLTTALKNNQDVTLYGYRRLGKSALIHYVFHQLKKEYHCIYSDVWGTASVEEFTKELANGIIKSTVFAKRKLTEKLADFLKSIGASFKIGIDGMPSVEMTYNDKNQVFGNLEELFAFLERLSHPVVLAIDEFQEIKKYDNEIPFEGKLRALTQQCNNVSFLFCGSEYHLLNEIFSTYNMPFYQSTRMLTINKIGRQEYKEFILRHFKREKRKVSPAVIDHILDITYLHTYYVQAAANLLYSQTVLPGSVEEFRYIYKDFILEKRIFYSELPERLTKQQFAVVKGFGQTGIVSTPTSADFMEKAKIRNSSSMYRVINSLLEKQIIIRDDEGYRLYDVFLEQFLKCVL
ncbi:MAG: ATP-binding protein [Bacteroidetes bacterium]|nr:ATP-binding protein [Bacteroidota bacterium]